MNGNVTTGSGFDVFLKSGSNLFRIPDPAQTPGTDISGSATLIFTRVSLVLECSRFAVVVFHAKSRVANPVRSGCFSEIGSGSSFFHDGWILIRITFFLVGLFRIQIRIYLTRIRNPRRKVATRKKYELFKLFLAANNIVFFVSIEKCNDCMDTNEGQRLFAVAVDLDPVVSGYFGWIRILLLVKGWIRIWGFWWSDPDPF